MRRPAGRQAQIGEKVGGVALLDEHGADDDQALQHELKVRIDVVELQDVGQQAEDQHAAEGAGQAAAAAHQAGAADDDGGDGVEFQPGAGVRLALAVLRHIEHRRDAGEQAGDRVGDDLHAAGVDAGQPRRLLVAADRVDIAAERREAQHRAVDDDRRDEEQAGHRDDAEHQRAQHVELGDGVGAGIDGQHRVVLAGGEPGDAERRHHHGERHDEGLQPAGDDDEAVDRAEAQADAGRDEQHAEHAELGLHLRQQEPQQPGSKGRRRRRRA